MELTVPVRGRNIFEDLPSGLLNGVNPYAQELVEACQAQTLPLLYGPYLREMKGSWKDLFARQSCSRLIPEKLILEVGVHKGKTLLEMAEAFPSYGFIGLDVTFKRVVVTARKARLRGLTNVLSVLADARMLGDLFGPRELGGCIVFFPDPWLKKKNQRHQRIINEAFMRGLEPLLERPGFFWMKTDAGDYFHEGSAAAARAGFLPAQGEQIFPEGDWESSFELMFKRKKVPIDSGKWILF
ncbi:MAG: hypothetical protein H6618_07330 [Deltaproteobacteria bacterium]|nr:hypothetical protein [Deltaproteobacteria bacterium]